ncbi:ribosome biogenesis GTPase YlqF [Risungbinella massiliensis]|uniref:ribosome biogenesis GTPase YlqF n=1 Tax=Risungbinella massiliensis TaxID=1329796 RepID=UPI0005CB941E|nr:ribosome biogenesis GTPase YlqF [Risungbinella massiliensis]
MSIQWFPGHMAKARRQVGEKLKQVDIVLELLDARAPLSSRNPMIEEVIAHKTRLILLTKADLADEKQTKAWIQYFKERGISVHPVDAQTGKGVQQIPAKAQSVLKELLERRKSKGIASQKVRAMVIGIPNVGKSSLINRLAKRTAAQTGDKPGVTRAQQWIRVGGIIELLDTPGILWPKFEDPTVGLKLALSNAIKEEILPVDEVAVYGIQLLCEKYPEQLKERYKLTDLDGEPHEILETIGKKRGCMQRGGTVNIEKAAEIVVTDIRSGRLGRLTFEWASDQEEKENGDSEEAGGSEGLVESTD